MPLDRQACDCCARTNIVCPECESTHVTARDDIHKLDPNSVVDYGFGEKPDTRELEYTHVCWDCGWSEDVTVKIERH